MYGEVVEGIEPGQFAHELRASRAASRDRSDESARSSSSSTLRRHLSRPQPAPTSRRIRASSSSRAVSAVFDSWNAPRAQCLSRAVWHLERRRHSGQCGADGLRQSRRPIRRPVSASAAIRRPDKPGLYGEFLVARAGRGHRCRHARRRSRSRGCVSCCPKPTMSWRRRLRSSKRTIATCRTSSSRSRAAGSTSCRRAAAKRTATAALRAAVDMTAEGLLTHAEAIQRIDAAQLEQLLHPTIDPHAKVVEVATGLSASPGAASGLAVFDADTAAARGCRRERLARQARDDGRRHPRPARRPKASSLRAAG